jgi:hypothetical protein
LHTNTSKPPNNKVHLDTYTLDHIVNGDGNSMKPYTHLIRAQPIPLVKPAEQKAAPSNPAPQMVMARSTISLAGRF